MPPRYTITEPHPTVAENHYMHAGRGGAGNHFKAPLTTPPQGVPTPIHPTVSRASYSSSSSSISSSGRFHSGRGGAGNAHSHIERPVLSFEDEFRREERRQPVTGGYHVGRGGAGNFAPVVAKTKSSSASRKGSSSSSMASSSSSSGSAGFLKRLSASFRKA